MYTSLDKSVCQKAAKTYLYISIGLLVFGIIYEQFAHGVNSNYMRYAFLIFLIGGAGVSLAFMKLPRPSWFNIQIWNMALATLTAGFLIKGVFDIYGSSSSLVLGYFVAAILLFSIAVIMYITSLLKHRVVQE